MTDLDITPQPNLTPPCPFCGGGKHIGVLRIGKDEIALSCAECGAQGPKEEVWASDEDRLHDAIMIGLFLDLSAWAWARRAR